jgi:hypothetical protein
MGQDGCQAADRVRDIKVEAEAIHQENAWNLSVDVPQAGTTLWGSLISCGRLSIGPNAHVCWTGGGIQPPRRLPANGCQAAQLHASYSTFMSHALRADCQSDCQSALIHAQRRQRINA